ncbi:hypothetical protein GOBAR_AA22315 [Gossypium barbadense]|uniref:UspA domain-containing protein n=1 Tax=Gossypium barbadense TaxID=3634 RepID=A0A2P5X4U2_GOSBA|nr:hypothetical protein GOBAR_AA22315 [Gossypium barbadense]
MNPADNTDHPQLPTIKIHHPSSPHHPTSATTPTPTSGARRKIGVAVDLSDESAFAVRWAVQNYLRPGDTVILLHVSPTSVLFGADWGPLPQTPQNPETPQSQKQLEDDFDAFTASKAADLAKPLKEAGIHFKIHIVKDHDMRERLCLEVERYPEDKDGGDAAPVVNVKETEVVEKDGKASVVISKNSSL